MSGVAFSGSGQAADTLRLFASGYNGPTHGGTRYLVQGNTIQEYGEVGIQFNARQGNATIDATVLGNTIRQPGTAAAGAFGAIWVNSGALSNDTNTVNIAIGGTAAADKNTLTNTDPNNVDDVFLDTQSDSGAPPSSISTATAPPQAAPARRSTGKFSWTTTSGRWTNSTASPTAALPAPRRA